jgi:hypothetical protein
MNRGEAELILFWRQFLAGEMPPLVRGLSIVSSEAAATLAAGLVRLVVRYLLAQGGAHPDVSLAGDRRINQRALWTEPLLALDFRQPLFNLLAHLARKGTPPTESAEDLGAGGEVVLLMIADELASRPRPDLLLPTVTARSALAWLVHGGAGDHGLPDSSPFEDALFFARGRLARAWLALDPVSRTTSPTLGMLLERANERARAWARYRECVLAHRRFDLLAPLCAAPTALWAAIDADRLLARVEDIGRFAGESPRQDAYQRLLACYGWLADLEDWAAEARQLSRYDDEFDRWQVYLAYYGRMPEATHGQSTRLLAQLRRTL